MPVMNGYEAAQAIRASRRADSSVPIVAMTANAFSEDVERPEPRAMNAHVAKPIDPDELRRTAAGLLKKSPGRDREFRPLQTRLKERYEKRRNRLPAVLLSVAALLGALSGCGGRAASAASPADDIVTMKSLDTGKMTVTIRAEYNVNNEAIRSALAAKFPDVNFVSVFHCSQETQYELRQSLQGGSAEDIIISPNMKSISDIAPDTLLDLSARALWTATTAPRWRPARLNGKLYYLPGPLLHVRHSLRQDHVRPARLERPQKLRRIHRLVKTIDASVSGPSSPPANTPARPRWCSPCSITPRPSAAWTTTSGCGIIRRAARP
jgi:CheY-like chemotaxis protein